MRIGTWNLDNRLLTDQHRDLVLRERCDVWLLTEVNPQAVNPKGRIAGFHCHLSSGVMARKQHWAAVLSLQTFSPLADPHPASAAAIINGITYCSTILPWKGAQAERPWVGDTHSEKTEAAIGSLLKELPKSDLVWGGDWNHALEGSEVAGSMGGRGHLLAAIQFLNLQVPTAHLLHQKDICHAIDHVAVPSAWKVKSAARVVAKGLSDHDAYVVEIENGVSSCDSRNMT